MYLLGSSWRGQKALWSRMETGALTLAPLDEGDAPRMRELMEKRPSANSGRRCRSILKTPTRISTWRCSSALGDSSTKRSSICVGRSTSTRRTPRPNRNLSVALGLQGRIDEATRAARAAVRIRPESAEARKQLDLLLRAELQHRAR
jgi:hypothetical protein